VSIIALNNLKTDLKGCGFSANFDYLTNQIGLHHRIEVDPGDIL
jgi:hypothetical protein